MTFKVKVWPCYFMCDASASMSGITIDLATSALEKIWIEMIKSPGVSDKAWVSVISFTDTAEVLVPLTESLVLSEMPSCLAEGDANYGHAFRKIRETIDNDVLRLKSERFRVIRPVIFFISNGQPADEDWRHAYADLVDEGNVFRPHIIGFACKSTANEIISEVATSRGVSGISSVCNLTDDSALMEQLRELFTEIIRL